MEVRASLPLDFASDVIAGERLYLIGGCSNCHLSSMDTDTPGALGGGQELKTDFGTFFAPNISPDPANGIGSWS